MVILIMTIITPTVLMIRIITSATAKTRTILTIRIITTTMTIKTMTLIMTINLDKINNNDRTAN